LKKEPPKSKIRNPKFDGPMLSAGNALDPAPRERISPK
jgi:hypothetical protein